LPACGYGYPHRLTLEMLSKLQASMSKMDARIDALTEIELNEIYGSMATSLAITKLRDEVAQSIDRENDLDLRISAIESRLGIKNPLAPTEQATQGKR
jgi:hypothetical protein